MKPLIESCRKAIADGRCLGCQALENPDFIGNSNCEYLKIPTKVESIMQIKINLGVQENVNKNTFNVQVQEK